MARFDEYRGFLLRYGCDPSALRDDLARVFVRLTPDEETRAFIDRVTANPPGAVRRALHRVLLQFFSDFDADGIAGMYPLHLLSSEQWAALLAPEPRRRQLDVGAGSGDVTESLRPFCSELTATETSGPMSRRLRQRGIHCLRTDLTTRPVPDPPYERITCLNVIDRCARPLSLLRNLLDALGPRGELILATPLPFRPFYYEGPQTREPREPLPIHARDWESSVTELVSSVLEPLGLRVRALSRAPYLSGGDAGQSLYVLDDAVFVCEMQERD